MEQWVIRSLTDRFPIRSGLTVLWITVGELSNFLLSAAVFFLWPEDVFRHNAVFTWVRRILLYLFMWYHQLPTINTKCILFFFILFCVSGFCRVLFYCSRKLKSSQTYSIFLDCHFLCVRVRPACLIFCNTSCHVTLRHFSPRDFATGCALRCFLEVIHRMIVDKLITYFISNGWALCDLYNNSGTWTC